MRKSKWPSMNIVQGRASHRPLNGKEFACSDCAWVWSFHWENHMEKEMETHSSILVWETPWTEESSRLQFMGLQRVRHNVVTKQLHFHFPWLLCQCRETQVWSLEKETAPYSSILVWETPWTEEFGSLQSMGLQTVGQDLVAKQQQKNLVTCFLVGWVFEWSLY